MKIKLPNINSSYKITKEKIDYFWENGFVVLKNVLSKEEIGAYRKEIKNLQANFIKFLEILEFENIKIERPNYSQVISYID